MESGAQNTFSLNPCGCMCSNCQDADKCHYSGYHCKHHTSYGELESRGYCVTTQYKPKSWDDIRGPMKIKDSGKRESFSSGMVRDTCEDKINYLLVRDGPMYTRWAQHLTGGAIKYAKRNWMLASGQEEYERFRESAVRHFEQWLAGHDDEDHAAAVYFNINGAEYVKGKRT